MKQSDFHQFVMQDLFAEIPGITSRAMFGGYGIYKDGVIFGLIADDVLYFKVDDTNRAQYEEKESKPFTYDMGNHKPTTMSYWEVPSDIIEDRGELEKWIETSVEVSKKAKLKKR